MTTNQLQNVIRATPFRRFVIHLADGRELAVPHPELIAHEPNGRIAVVVRPGDAFEVIDPLLVSRLEVRSSAPTAARSDQGA